MRQDNNYNETKAKAPAKAKAGNYNEQNMKAAKVTRDANGKIVIEDDIEQRGDGHVRAQKQYQPKYKHKYFNSEIQGEGSKKSPAETKEKEECNKNINGPMEKINISTQDRGEKEEGDKEKENNAKGKNENTETQAGEEVDNDKMEEEIQFQKVGEVFRYTEGNNEEKGREEEEITKYNDNDERVECSLKNDCNIQKRFNENNKEAEEEIEDDEIEETEDGDILSTQREKVQIEEYTYNKITTLNYHSDGENECRTPTQNEDEFSKVKTKSQKRGKGRLRES